ncbi:MAG: hypothetical protein M3P23_04195 [Actinomycetota bacterium]|nr:hypothetical protein [Actinomycetota bacterium]
MTSPPSPWPGSARSRVLAWALAALASLGFVVLVVLNLRHDGLAAFSANLASGVLLVGTFVSLGTLLALRQPANPIGWLMTAGGLTWLSSEAAVDYATYALADGHATRAAALAASYDANIWPVGVTCAVGLPLLLFPAGRTRSPRWLWVLRVMIAACVVLVVASALMPGTLDTPTSAATATLLNPLGVPLLKPALTLAINLSLPVFMLATLTAVVGVIARFRSAAGLERQQLRWVLTGAVLAISGMLLVYLSGVLLHLSPGAVNVVVTVGLGCLPVSLTIAILRYRLYDLDRIVSRTVSYAAVSGVLIATYVGLVTGVSRLIPDNSRSLAVAASTLAVAALLQPLRRRMQAVVDRRFNRSRYNASRTVEAFSARLREQVDLAALEVDLLTVVRESMQPASAALWLRRTGGAPS